jgi:hypothetical protein
MRVSFRRDVGWMGFEELICNVMYELLAECVDCAAAVRWVLLCVF